ncbi:MAG TPA: hypothetical protein VGO93_06950 [Candidatus Xenobia bacterium]|jgi:hypothetical protein
MMVEGPALQAAIGRLPERELNLAAWGLTIQLSLLVESPVIMLLATSIALARDKAAWEALRRFVLNLCLGCTVVAGVLAFTPLYSLVTRQIMRVPEPIVVLAMPALGVMLLWSAAIGWRRSCQGLLVRYGQSRFVSWGTAIRLGTLGTTAAVLVHLGTMTGVVTAAISIMAGVLAEAVTATLFVQPTLRALSEPVAPPPTQRSILTFHLPLAVTSLISLLAGPLESAFLARLPHPVETLATWPVAFMLILVVRSGCFALQEVTVAQAADARLSTFAWAVGLAASAILLCVVATPLLPTYLEHVIHLPPTLWSGVRSACLLAAVVPVITALSAHRRGLCVAAHETSRVYKAMGMSLLAQTAFLAGGVWLQGWPMGIAAGGLTTAAVVEYLSLRGGSAAPRQSEPHGA